MRLWSNGWHASIALPAEVLDETHPVRALFPEKAYFLIGWGARDFFMADDPGLWEGLKAVVPPTRSALHVIAGDRPVEEGLWRPRKAIAFAVSRTGARAMGERIAASLEADENGAPVIVAEGRVPQASYFLAAKGGFHLFNMCNHWAARALREAGVPVSAAVSFTAPALLRAVERKAPASCAPEDLSAPDQP